MQRLHDHEYGMHEVVCRRGPLQDVGTSSNPIFGRSRCGSFLTVKSDASRSCSGGSRTTDRCRLIRRPPRLSGTKVSAELDTMHADSHTGTLVKTQLCGHARQEHKLAHTSRWHWKRTHYFVHQTATNYYTWLPHRDGTTIGWPPPGRCWAGRGLGMGAASKCWPSTCS